MDEQESRAVLSIARLTPKEYEKAVVEFFKSKHPPSAANDRFYWVA
jgi:hypothetical protein